MKAGAVYEVTSDENGYARFKDIPFGKYLVEEVTGKTGYQVSATNAAITVDIVR